MKDTLKRFLTEPLFDASAALLAHLHITFNPMTRQAVPFASLYPQPMPKALREVLDKVEATYFIGTVDESSLSGRTEPLDAADVTGRASEGRYSGMMLFAVDVRKRAELTRSECATLTRGFNRIARAQPVILFIRQGDTLALSTCERSQYTQQWRNGEKLGRVSLLRGIDCQHPHRGHLDILTAVGDRAFSSFEDLYKHWMEVFSNELLTKKFYGELSDWYAWAVQVARFPNDLTTTDDDEKFNHESCIRLITRLIFVWFLKQKRLIPEQFFDEGYIREHLIEGFNPHDRNNLLYNPEQSKYYRLILQNLFFAMLNCPIVAEGKDTPNNRRFRGDGQKGYVRDGYNVNNLMRYKSDFKKGGAEKFVQMANSHVPFLNGGLFDCLDKKKEKLYYDGFSERKESLEQLYLPDWLFFGDEVGRCIDLSQWYGDDAKKKKVAARGIIDILKRYNFTIEENTPLDQEVSLDPELLGKAFENLLASYNPETQTTARKQTGSFYTPREIVQYMVDESLVAHLKRTCGDELEKQYRSLLSYSTEEVTLSSEQRHAIMHAIYHCKVLDPACGSGAFPMGVLQQMVHILRQLDPSNEMWKAFMREMAVEQSKAAFAKDEAAERKARMADIEEAFNKSINCPDYARKLYLIEHCIYGVDIQPIAVQISKLRFFISLVVDQKPTTDAAHNFGIRPLPNLESKFVAANTLIPVDYKASFIESGEAVSYRERLKELNHQIFLAKRNTDKQRLKEDILQTRHALAKAIENTGFVNSGVARQLADWDMFEQNTASGFFNPEWMFGLSEGFDIVIGNPPFIQLQNNGGELAKLYENGEYQTFARTGDLYCLFYERGWQLLKEHGHLCFISSNKWMRAGYGENTRAFFAKKTNPKLLIDFAGVRVFESATVDTNILLFAKGKNSHATRCAVANKQNKDSLNNLSDFVQHNASTASFQGSDSWVILSPIEQSIKRKIEAVGTPLKDWDINIYRGVLTGYNEAFIISTEKRNEILNNCRDAKERQRTEELIRPILRGRDIKRYGYEWAGLYLIATFPSRHYDIEKYPAVKQYLLSFGIERLEQTGRTHTINGEKVKARKKTNNKWFETQDSISYWEDFDKPKILWKRIGSILRFSYDDGGKLGLDSTCLATGNHIPYLCCILNSEMGLYLFKDAPKTGTGDLLVSVQAIEPIFVPYDASAELKLNGLLNAMIRKPNENIEKEISHIVYALYDLSPEERTYVSDFVKQFQ